MRTMMSSRELVKWSVITVKGALAVLAVLPRLKEMLESQSGLLDKRLSGSVSGGLFGLLLLDERGNVITTRQFASHEVRGGFVNASVIQQAALSAGADAAVLTYQSPGCLVDSPATHREVVRQIFAALAEVDVQLLSRASLNTDK